MKADALFAVLSLATIVAALAIYIAATSNTAPDE